MSDPRRLPVVGDLNRQAPQPSTSDHTNKPPVVLMDGLPLRSTYLINCRLCLSETFGKNNTSIMDEQFRIILLSKEGYRYMFVPNAAKEWNYSIDTLFKCWLTRRPWKNP
uniref:Uncharacterized protein n=1 Tax=Anopheles minimus TaxID=112268 RepID=A0A182WBH2_9DIPT